MDTSRQNCSETGSDGLVEEIEQLVWDLLDDQINISGLQRLEQVIREDPVARATYLDCVRMHVDLTEIFSQSADADAANLPNRKAPSPILTLLGEIPEEFGAAPPLPGTPIL